MPFTICTLGKIPYMHQLDAMRFTLCKLENVPDGCRAVPEREMHPFRCHAYLVDEAELCPREHHALLERKQYVILPQDLSLAEKVFEHLTPDRLKSCQNRNSIGKDRAREYTTVEALQQRLSRA